VSDIERKTFRLDCVRFIFQGFIDAEFKTYVLLFAIRIFDMPDRVKGILSATVYLGLVMAPFALKFFSKIWPLKNNQAIAALLCLVAANIAIAAWTKYGVVFLICIALAQMLYKLTLPFVTDIYNRNYPRVRRGQIIGTLFTILAVAGVLLSYFIGKMLDRSLGNYRFILLLAVFSALICCRVFMAMPNGRVIAEESTSVFRSNLSILLNDKLFSSILCLWSLMSVAFQMIFPLRMEYVANAKYGINLSNADITTLMVVVPTITRVASAFFWGKIFDAQNFAVMKILVNCCYLVSIPLFFFGKSFFVLVLSATILGIGFTGNLTAWQLWVTKIVPSSEKLGAYVSIDMIVMGLRDAFSAGLGYYLLSKSFSLHTICLISTALIAISIVGFCCFIKNPRLR
jgi:MFS family permease